MMSPKEFAESLVLADVVDAGEALELDFGADDDDTVWFYLWELRWR